MRIERDLRNALAVLVFVELGFLVALLALGGMFNGGRPTSTPPFAVAYLIASPIVTIAVIFRTWQMLKTTQRGDLVSLRRMNLRPWSLIAFVFSAILPTFFLDDAAVALNRSPGPP